MEGPRRILVADDEKHLAEGIAENLEDEGYRVECVGDGRRALERILADDYDLVILDTPPSRNALRFLDAPSRATAFLDRRVLGLFIPGSENRIRRAATKMFEGLLDLAFGVEARKELQQFFPLL